MRLTLITEHVNLDEKAWRLVEIVMTPYDMSKGGKRFKPQSWLGRRRWEVVWVLRNDRLAQHITDMGDAGLYNFGAINIPACWEHSVAELREIAEKVRNDGAWEREVIANVQGESKLIEQFLIQQQRKQKAAKRQSVFVVKQ